MASPAVPDFSSLFAEDGDAVEDVCATAVPDFSTLFAGEDDAAVDMCGSAHSSAEVAIVCAGRVDHHRAVGTAMPSQVATRKGLIKLGRQATRMRCLMKIRRRDRLRANETIHEVIAYLKRHLHPRTSMKLCKSKRKNNLKSVHLIRAKPRGNQHFSTMTDFTHCQLAFDPQRLDVRHLMYSLSRSWVIVLLRLAAHCVLLQQNRVLVCVAAATAQESSAWYLDSILWCTKFANTGKKSKVMHFLGVTLDQQASVWQVCVILMSFCCMWMHRLTGESRTTSFNLSLPPLLTLGTNSDALWNTFGHASLHPFLRLKAIRLICDYAMCLIANLLHQYKCKLTKLTVEIIAHQQAAFFRQARFAVDMWSGDGAASNDRLFAHVMNLVAEEKTTAAECTGCRLHSNHLIETFNFAVSNLAIVNSLYSMALFLRTGGNHLRMIQGCNSMFFKNPGMPASRPAEDWTRKISRTVCQYLVDNYKFFLVHPDKDIAEDLSDWPTAMNSKVLSKVLRDFIGAIANMWEMFNGPWWLASDAESFLSYHH